MLRHLTKDLQHLNRRADATTRCPKVFFFSQLGGLNREIVDVLSAFLKFEAVLDFIRFLDLFLGLLDLF